MSFGGEGEHRGSRSGGSIKRKNGEIFANTFQGKIAEMGIYNIFLKENINIPDPDFNTYELGKWDDYNFEVNDKKIAVKSTKHFGQLLLLEKRDWNSRGEYIPNIKEVYSLYDFFIFVRIRGKIINEKQYVDIESILKKNKLLYSNDCKKENLEELISEEKLQWEYDSPGYITQDHLKYAINNKFIIPKGSLLNGKTKMDASNYYIQAGDMLDINEIFKYF